MPDSLKVGDRTIRVAPGDITDMDVEAFVFYASHDLRLGSGHGTAITVRGGPSIQEELDGLGRLETTGVVTTGAGKLKAQKILHAVGPRFQEEGLEAKLRTTMRNCLREAERQEIRRLAFPTMGTGFYGVPLALSARVMLEIIQEHLSGESTLDEVVIVPLDRRDAAPFDERLEAMRAAPAM
ncbi:MAG: macro domain-containing protein [Candidatus Eiseniibacteriota bacterium]|jgi:O-acetyl-ADP-ribose deacetylase (regulator of RNase III)